MDAGVDANDSGSAQAITQNAAVYTAPGFVQIIPGSQAYMIAGGDASPWVLGYPSHNIFHYTNDLSGPRDWKWATNDNATRSIAVSPEGTPWKIDNSGNIKRGSWNGSIWVWSTVGTGSPLAWEIGVGANNTAWAIAQAGNCTQNVANADCPIYQGSAAATDWLTSDFYIALTDSTLGNARVYKSPVASHGTSWTALAGTTYAVPGMLKTDEYIEAVAVDSSARAVSSSVRTAPNRLLRAPCTRSTGQRRCGG